MININPKSKEPLYSQIYNQIKQSIIEGRIKSGEKLKSKRNLSKELSVSVNTIDTAYGQLVSEGFIKSVPQSGFYVCDIESLDIINFDKKEIKKNIIEPKKYNNYIDFSLYGIDIHSFPYTSWKKLIREVISLSPEEFLKTSPSQGEFSLRCAISSHIYIRRGVITSPDNIVIGAGTDNLMEILNGILEKDCKIAMEDPVYSNSYRYFNRMGHKIISVPTDEKGVITDNIKNIDNTALYITPSHQFPLGITMPVSRRIEILKWAKKGEKRYIIEDDYDSEFRYNSKPISSLQSIDRNGNIIYLGSFSRSISPSLRISYIVLPEKLMETYKENYKDTSCPVSRLEQLVLEKFISSGQYEKHINRMRKIYSEKRDYTIKKLVYEFGEDISFYGENAGHHILFKIKNYKDEKEICKKAFLNNIKIYAVSDFYKGTVPEKFKGAVMAGYGNLSFEDIEKGIKILKKSL